jgi:hypothetical protein
MQFIYACSALSSNLGHPANTCRFVTGELRRRGIEPKVFAYQSVTAELRAELGATGHFRAHTYYAPDSVPHLEAPDPIYGWLKSFITASEITLQDLHRLPPVGRDDVVYFNSAQPPQLMAIVLWLSSLPPEALPQVVVEFATEPGLNISTTPEGMLLSSRDPRRDPSAAFYRLAGSKISAHVQKHLHMMTFDRESSRIYAVLIQHPVGVLPLPQTAIGSLRRRVANGAVTIAVLGHQRPDKGYSLMPVIARRLLQDRGGHIRLLVHNGAPEQMLDAQKEMRSLADSDRRITIDERIAGPAVWAELLAAADLILCPYFPEKFRASYSAVTAEAIANAIPVVAPAGTAMDRLIQECGGCGTLFGEFQPEAIVAATVAAIDDFDRYAALAYAAAEQWPQRYGPDRLVEAILACAVRPPQVAVA